MKRVILLLLATTPIVFISAQSKKEKDKTVVGYAITSPIKGQTGWNEVRQVNILTGEEVKQIYKNKQEIEILNARTKQPVAKKDIDASKTPVVKKVVNLDNELNPSVHRVVYYKEAKQSSDRPFATNSAAMAYDKKHERLYYTPMSINQLRYIDLKSNKIYYFENEAFGVVSGSGDVSNQITRMIVASDGNGYALSNNAEHLIRFDLPKKVENTEITDLGALTDDPANGKYSVHNKAGYGGDMVADAQGYLYLITANRNVFKIDIKTKVASYKGTIVGLPQGFSTNGAMVQEGSKVIVASSQSTVGYYSFDLKTMQAEKISEGADVYNASDLANATLAFEKERKQKKEPEKTESPVTEQTIAQNQKPSPQSETPVNNGLVVYPNPVTNGYFNVTFTDQPAGKYQMQVFDASGKMVSSKDVVITNNSQIERFELPSLVAAGNYLLKVTGGSNNISISHKLTVQ